MIKQDVLHNSMTKIAVVSFTVIHAKRQHGTGVVISCNFALLSMQEKNEIYWNRVFN